jgi:hypothetical protein
MSLAPRARALLALLLLLTTTVVAQQPLVLVFPQNGATDVTTRPEIVVLSPAPIDAASITTRWPNAETNGYRSDEPTLLVLRESDAHSIPRELWTRHAVRVRYTQIDPRLLRMTVGTLQAGTRYMCLLQRVSVDGGTILPPLEFNFTTRHDVPRLLSHSLLGVDALRCTDSIRLVFTSPLTTLPTEIGAYVSCTVEGRPHPVSFEVDARGRGVTVVPTVPWPAGGVVRMQATMSAATGDALDDLRVDVPVRAAGRLRVHARAVDASVVPDALSDLLRANDVVAVRGATYELRCPTWLDERWRFVRWECAHLPEVHGSTSASMSVTLPCEKLSRTIDVDAVIERVDTVKVPIDVDDGTVEVYDDDGALLREIDGQDTLVCTPGAALTLHAVAAAGMTFGSWSAAGTVVNSSTAPAVVIGMQMMHPGHPGGTVGPTVKPRVMPQLPGERFRLRGELRDMDPDEQFDVEAAVTWTTDRKYEEPISIMRSLCIEATDDWEILGYISIYGRTMYDQPQRNACVNDLLLDPEHVVTFLVRRIPLHLRVEMALLDSDDADDVIMEKHPHADVRISADVRRRRGGTSVWVPLGDVPCRTARQLARMGWKVSAGDEVRLRIRDAASRGELWRFFAPVTNYLLPGGGERDRDTWLYTLTASASVAHFDAEDCAGRRMARREIRARACFRADLGIDAIGVRVRVGGNEERGAARFVQRWLDPLTYYDRADDEPIGGRHLEYIPRMGTPVKVRFTRPIDITSIEGGSMMLESFGNMDPLDPMRTNMDFTVRSSAEGHIGYEPFTGEPVNTVIFNAYKPNTAPRLQATYGGSVELLCTTSIRSLRGVPLRAPATFAINTVELPGYGLMLRSVGLAYDGDWDFWPFTMYGEIYHGMYGGVLAWDKALHVDQGFRRLPDCAVQQGRVPDECTFAQSDDDAPMQFGDMLQYIEPFWMDRYDLAFSHILTYDEDCKDEDDCLVNRIDEILADLRDDIKDTKGSKNDKIDWDSFIPGLLRVGVDLINGLMAPDDQDEYLGESTVLEGAATRWGAAKNNGIIIGRGQNTTYEYKARLMPRAAIVY